VNSPILCGYCGKGFDAHGGEICPVLSRSLTELVRGTVALVTHDRSERAKTLALSQAVTPRVYGLTNVAGQSLMILSYNENRGVALVYNDDAADVWLGSDRQHIEDATRRFPLKTKCAVVFTSPAELWAIGNAAGPQLVSVLELPPGRGPIEYAAFAKLA